LTLIILMIRLNQMSIRRLRAVLHAGKRALPKRNKEKSNVSRQVIKKQ
jgi:hypothetical protein